MSNIVVCQADISVSLYKADNTRDTPQMLWDVLNQRWYLQRLIWAGMIGRAHQHLDKHDLRHIFATICNSLCCWHAVCIVLT